jgi:tRNA-uridine 2-sulfurtransferase
MVKTKQKVYIGMSGGVDSSVAAALLLKMGYQVTGVFIKAWDPSTSSGQVQLGFKCTWREDRRDAMRVAAQLGIPFVTLDLEPEYKKKVVDYMIAEYRSGRTPNPDVMCNKEIKFGLFYNWAISQGADYVATGHYAKVQLLDKGFQLLAAIDKEKDQTYFLWNIRTEQLSHILFPIGNMLKSEVRELALKFKLPVALKKDSQGLCFMGKLDVKEFLKQYLPITPGEVLDQSGKKVGTHEGTHFYTLGERHGFRITASSPTQTPFYIVAKDKIKNTLVVSHQQYASAAEHCDQVALENINLITGEKLNAKKSYSARVRYRQPLQQCKIEMTNERMIVRFDTPQKAIASGQSLVLYDGEQCLGGGVIA